MEFISRTQVIIAIGAVGLTLYVLDLVRRRRLSEEYSFLWVLATVCIAVLGFTTPLLRAITHALGMLFESSTVFALGLAFVVAMLLYQSIKMSRLATENLILARELALLRSELEQRAPAAAAPGSERA
jgi:hypothetical protein